MEASRGKKGKKARWHVTLGLKEAIFAGLGVAGLMMMAFALGTLAGRGDIYRVFYQWGLLNPEAAKVAQWPPPGMGPSAPLVSPMGGETSAAAPVPATAPGAVAATPAPSGQPAPVTGSIAPVPATSSTSPKKAKGGSLLKDQKAKDEELRKVRQEVVSKLKFQNSFDTHPKPRVAQKPKDKTPAAKGQTSQVRVAQYRDSKTARAKIAELEKKGIKATLKQGKDAKGPLYTVYKQAPPSKSESENLAQKPQSGEKKAKPGAE